MLIDESWQGRRWVVETDIANCFEAIGHYRLMQAIEERVCDRAVLSLLRGMLRAGVMEDGSLRRSTAGTPQGGVISPVLCNVYLHRLDRAWSAEEHGVLVRYADDALVMCATREQAEAALARLTALLAELGLEPKAAKTRIVHLAEGEEGFDFLGFHHRLVRGWTPKSAHLTFLARWPSRKAVQRARDRIREITGRKWLWMPAGDIVRDLNLFLRGWAGYFRYGNSARVLGQIRNYALVRLASWLSKKGNRRTGLGMGHQTGAAVTEPPGPDQPRWNRPPAQAFPGLAGEHRTPPVKNVGKPCAGEPHARFDGRGLETGRELRNRASPRPS